MIETFPSSVESFLLDVGACFSAKGWLLPSRSLLKQFDEVRPDIVYTDYPHYPVWYAKIHKCLSRRNVPVIAHLRGDWWTEFDSWISTSSNLDKVFAVHRYYFTHMALGLADMVTPICRALDEIVLKHFPSKRTFVIPQGVDPSIFYKEQGIQLEHPNVCIIQNHTIFPKVKGLLEFARVTKDMPDVSFYISGGQPISQTYESLVRDTFANSPNVHMLGKVDYPSGLRQLLSEADVYVLASGLDMCPTTVLEAALMERPVVASRVGGVPELILEGKTGYTIPNGDVLQWKTILRAILSDTKLAKRLGINAKHWVSENFSWNKIGERTLEAIRMAFEPNKGNQ